MHENFLQYSIAVVAVIIFSDVAVLGRRIHVSDAHSK